MDRRQRLHCRTRCTCCRNCMATVRTVWPMYLWLAESVDTGWMRLPCIRCDSSNSLCDRRHDTRRWCRTLMPGTVSRNAYWYMPYRWGSLNWWRILGGSHLVDRLNSLARMNRRHDHPTRRIGYWCRTGWARTVNDAFHRPDNIGPMDCRPNRFRKSKLDDVFLLCKAHWDHKSRDMGRGTCNQCKLCLLSIHHRCDIRSFDSRQCSLDHHSNLRGIGISYDHPWWWCTGHLVHMGLVRKVIEFVRGIRRTGRLGNRYDRSIVRDYLIHSSRHSGHTVLDDTIRAPLVVNCTDGMDCRRDLRDRNKLDFVKRRTMHHNRTDSVRMGFSAQRNPESCSGFRCNHANMCISRIHC